MKSLEGTTSLVTGASGGIGEAIAMTLASEGSKVILNYHNNKQSVDRIYSNIINEGWKASICQADITRYTDVTAMFQQYIPNILINNAGIHLDARVQTMGLDVWHDVIDLCLNGAFYCTQAYLLYKPRDAYGRIINITSAPALEGLFGAANYATAKAGLIGFTKSVAKEVARKNCTCNAVSLGHFNTGMGMALSPELKKVWVPKISMDRFGKHEEAADVVAFLASSKSSYMNGSVVTIDGGCK